jgi:hypothetical protein
MVYCTTRSGLRVRGPGYRLSGSGFDSWRYQLFGEIVGLEQGARSLVRKVRRYLNEKKYGFSLEI